MLFELYTSILDTVINIRKFPYELENFDKYQFSSLISKKEIESLEIITDSDEINEAIEYGEYIYRFGILHDLYIIYHESTHYGIWPNRIIIIDKYYTMIITEDISYIELYETNQSLYQIIELKDPIERKKNLFDYIKNTTRPRLELKDSIKIKE